MKKLKFIITIVITFLSLQVVTIKHQDNILNQINYQSISVQNSNLNFNQYVSTLTKISDDNDILMLSSHVKDEHTDWYCVGSKCGLNGDEYYSTENDSKAKAVLPVDQYGNPKVKSFSQLNNISTSNIAFTLIGNDKNIKSAIQDLDKSVIGIEQNNTGGGATLSNISEILIYIFALSLIWVTILTFQSKQYILEKYNGLYFNESIKPIFITTLVPILFSSGLSFVVISLKLDNHLLFSYLLPYLLRTLCFVIIGLTSIELIICLFARRTSLKYANVSNKQLNAVRIVVILVIMISASNVAVSGYSIAYSIDKLNSLPPSKYDDYYTYGLRMPGSFDFDFADKVIDKGNVEFYKATEDEFNGIVTSFNDHGSNVVNINYLQAINRDINLDEDFINILVSDNTYDNVDLPSYAKLVPVDNDTYPYLDWETGLVNYYTGPVVVINSNAISKIDNIDTTIVSMYLQVNNYYLTGDLKKLENVRHDLNMDDYFIEFYDVPSISNDYSIMMYKRLFVSSLALLITTTSIICFIIIYLKLNFELNKKDFAIKFYTGQDIRKKFNRTAIFLLLPSFIIFFVNPSVGFIVYFLALLIICLIVNNHYFKKQIKNNPQYIRE